MPLPDNVPAGSFTVTVLMEDEPKIIGEVKRQEGKIVKRTYLLGIDPEFWYLRKKCRSMLNWAIREGETDPDNEQAVQRAE